MQRKNSFLARSGFAMVMAVSVIILVSTIMILSLNSTALTSKRTVDLYIYEQAELHIKSAIEYALYKIAKDGCTDQINETTPDGIYDINITMKYIFDSDIAGCTEYIDDISTPEQNGSVMMDVRVSVDSNVTSAEPITLFRRTIQKL